ncbi:hypothetical protein ACQ4PT_004740 [Festuca glaucescens]
MASSPIDEGCPVAQPCPWLPDDIVVDIFARLPAKSVGRCRCLSSAWAATLSSDDFEDRYYRLANRRQSPKVVFFHYANPEGQQMRLWSQDCPSGASSRMDVPCPTSANTISSSSGKGGSVLRTIPFRDPVIRRQFPLIIVPLVCRILRYLYKLLHGPVQSSQPMNRACRLSCSAAADIAKTVNGGALISEKKNGGALISTKKNGGGPIRLATLQCRGLVLLQNSAEVSYLCNPSTRQMAALPQGRGRKEAQRMDPFYGYYENLGLGYDVQTKKHKVVRIYYQGCDLQGLPRCAGCEIYVVNSTARWQPIREKPPAWVKYNRPSVFVQGHVHWLAQRKINMSTNALGEMDIVSFSFADHTFGTVEPPLGMESLSLSKHELTTLDGHLCLFSNKVSQSSCYDIWQLPEHGGRVWNLRCRIDMNKVSPDITDRFVRCLLHPLAIINNGSRILLAQPGMTFAYNYSRMCTYDPVTGDVDDIDSGSSIIYHWIIGTIDAAVYEESIISFG